jgi:hypothetical protein
MLDSECAIRTIYRRSPTPSAVSDGSSSEDSRLLLQRRPPGALSWDEKVVTWQLYTPKSLHFAELGSGSGGGGGNSAAADDVKAAAAAFGGLAVRAQAVVPVCDNIPFVVGSARVHVADQYAVDQPFSPPRSRLTFELKMVMGQLWRTSATGADSGNVSVAVVVKGTVGGAHAAPNHFPSFEEFRYGSLCRPRVDTFDMGAMPWAAANSDARLTVNCETG